MGDKVDENLAVGEELAVEDGAQEDINVNEEHHL